MKKVSKSLKKLALHRETLQPLAGDELEAANGGASAISAFFSCFGHKACGGISGAQPRTCGELPPSQRNAC